MEHQRVEGPGERRPHREEVGRAGEVVEDLAVDHGEDDAGRRRAEPQPRRPVHHHAGEDGGRNEDAQKRPRRQDHRGVGGLAVREREVRQPAVERHEGDAQKHALHLRLDAAGVDALRCDQNEEPVGEDGFQNQHREGADAAVVERLRGEVGGRPEEGDEGGKDVVKGAHEEPGSRNDPPILTPGRRPFLGFSASAFRFGAPKRKPPGFGPGGGCGVRAGILRKPRVPRLMRPSCPDGSA